MSVVFDPASFPGVWRGGELDRAAAPGLATGFPLLDSELPGGGLPRSGLVEVLHDGVGLGEVSLLLGAIRLVAAQGRVVAWVDPPHLPYAPALAAAGLALEACLVIRPASPENALWAADQCLRSGACGAVLCWPPAKADYASLRRLQMAAESGRCLAVLFRACAAASQASPAHLRIQLSANQERLLVSLPKRRGPPLLQPVSVRIPGRPSSCARASA